MVTGDVTGGTRQDVFGLPLSLYLQSCHVASFTWGSRQGAQAIKFYSNLLSHTVHVNNLEHISVFVMMKQTRFASNADVCVVERVDEHCPRNSLFYSKEEYRCFRRGVVKDVLVCRSRRQKGLPMETAAVDTTFGIEQHLGDRVDEPKMVRSAHSDAILKAQERAAKDESVCLAEHLRDVSLGLSTVSMALARFIGIKQSRAT